MHYHSSDMRFETEKKEDVRWNSLTRERRKENKRKQESCLKRKISDGLVLHLYVVALYQLGRDVHASKDKCAHAHEAAATRF